MKIKIQNLIIALAVFAGVHQAAAQGTTAFTYQGQLHDGGTNANGTYTMIFKLYDAVTSGNQIGSTITTSPTLANGLFSVNLDFGNAFDGTARWLDITVTNGGVAQTLSPRVQLLPTPYALFSAVAATVTNGAIMNAQLAVNAVNTTNIQNNAVTTTQIASAAVTNRNLTANAVATINIQDAAVTDAKIVSVSGSKISGGVAFATNALSATTAGSALNALSLVNGSWSAGVVTNPQNGQAVFGIFASSSPVLSSLVFGVSADGSLFNLHGNGINFSSGARIIDNGDGSLTIGINGSNFILRGSRIISSDNTASLGFNTGALSVTGDFVVSGTAYAQSFSTTSDRNLKEQFTPIDSREVLERVASLPISRWNFKTDAATRHIGPMAQDFYAAFNVGTDDKHIATVDEGGVALAAIQGLNEKLNDKDAEIKALEKRLADLEQLVKTSAQK